MSRSPRLSLRFQIALQAAAISVVVTAVSLAGIFPLWQIARSLTGEAAARGRLLPIVVVAAAIVVFAVTYLFLVRWIAGPAERLLEATERIGTGLDAPLLSDGGPVLGRLGTAFERMGGRLDAERERVLAQVAELEAVNRELQSARDSAIRQEKLASVGRLASGVAHEIGNPLAAVMGYAELLRAEGASPEIVERIDRELRRIDRIVRDLLDYARPRGTDLQPVRLREVVERVLRLARPQRRFRGISIDLDDRAQSAVVRADEHHLGQALLNLLTNAADAMEGTGAIQVTIEREGDRAVVRVRDDGPGIPAENLQRLFDPFFTTKDPGNGTGLGLSLCHGWIESMGGALIAENHPAGGAELRIDLPSVG